MVTTPQLQELAKIAIAKNNNLTYETNQTYDDDFLEPASSSYRDYYAYCILFIAFFAGMLVLIW